MAKLVSTVGLPYMSAAIILSSVLQLLFGVFKLSYLQNVVTEPVIAGFMNALGIFLVQAQLKIFKTYTGAWLSGPALTYSLATTGLCFSIVKALPMLKLKLPVPPSLVGLLTSSVLAHALGWTAHIKTLADKVGHENFVGGLAALPTFTGFPNVPINQATLGVIGATAVSFVVCCVCLFLAEHGLLIVRIDPISLHLLLHLKLSFYTYAGGHCDHLHHRDCACDAHRRREVPLQDAHL